jgi:adenine-specific DNA-methyltransferase
MIGLFMTVQNNLQDAHAAVLDLVERFEKDQNHYLSASYQEQEARKDFLDKFFMALGWDVNHEAQTNPYEQEVKIEKSVTTGTAKRRADYSFSMAPHFTKRPRFFVEAKRPQHDIATPDNYFQSIRYSWSHQLPLVVLTDFHSFHIIDSRYRPDIKTALPRKLAVYNYREYRDPDVFAKIYWLFSREATLGDAIGKYADTLEKPTAATKQMGLFAGGYQNIDDAFLGQLDQYREDLARSFKRHNPELDSEQLTEVVQRLLDRLVFTRFLEDKLIEPNPIISQLGTKTSAWKQFVRECARLDRQYNGVVFKHHSILDSPTFVVDDAAFLAICDELTDPTSPYDFNAIPVEILGRIYERFLGKVVVATAKRATVEEKPDVRKAGGVFYTPDYIVTHMVEQALGPKVKGKSPEEILSVRTIDTSCGSGSFLIGVYEYILNELARTYAAKPKLAKKNDVVMRDGVVHLSIHKKREVLIKCIFGIDIDAQAVEVTQLSLYLKLLEDETTDSAQTQQLELAAALLPSLNQNIIVGNSLISPIDDANADDMFTIERYDALKAVDLHRTFPQVMQRGGGFDLVIGNPPYIKEYTNREAFDNVRESPYFQGKMDIWYMFACRALDILKPETGTLAFIATNNWTTNFGAKRLRGKVTKDARIEHLIDFGDFKVFKDAGIQTMILIAKRSTKPVSYVFDYRVLEGKKRTLADAQGLLAKADVANVTYLSPDFDRAKFGESPYTFSDATAETLLLKLESCSNFILNGSSEVAQGIVPNPDVVSTQALGKYSDKELKSGQISRSDPVFVIPKGLFDKPNRDERELIKPLFAPTDTKRYFLGKQNVSEIIYSCSALSAVLPERLKQHLLPYKRIMDERRETKFGRLPWYCLHWPRDKSFFEGAPRILSVRKCAEPTFSYTEDVAYVMMAFNIIKTDRINQKYLTALLNSKVVRYWLQHKGKMQGGQFQVDKEPLLAIPLVAPPSAEQQRIAKLVDLILQASEKLHIAVLDSERDRYQRLIDQTDAKIQEAVYTYYKLTDSDIDLISAQNT